METYDSMHDEAITDGQAFFPNSVDEWEYAVSGAPNAS